MATINDLWVAYLKEEGYEGGGYNTLTVNALRDTTGTTKDSVNTLWYLYLTGLGYSGTINDMQYKWLGDNGYTGALNDRWKAALEDGFSFLGFDPLSLFDEGQQGIWYDLSDLTTLFQDSAGTTPVTADGDPVGLMLDKSGNGNHATQPSTASKPETSALGLSGDGDDDFMLSSEIGYTGPILLSFVGKSSALGQPDYSAFVSLANSGSLQIAIRGGEIIFDGPVGGVYPEDLETHVFSVLLNSAGAKSRIDGVTLNENSETELYVELVKILTNRGGSRFLNGDIGELVLACGEYDEATLNKVEKYLAAKAGVAL